MARIRKAKGRLALGKVDEVDKGQTVSGVKGHIDDLVFILKTIKHI